MTKQEAIEWVLGCIYHDGFIHTKRFDVANQVIKEALEKQIPKEPIIEYMPLFKAYCPTCEGRLLPAKWCAKCGQSISWGHEK